MASRSACRWLRTAAVNLIFCQSAVFSNSQPHSQIAQPQTSTDESSELGLDAGKSTGIASSTALA